MLFGGNQSVIARSSAPGPSYENLHDDDGMSQNLRHAVGIVRPADEELVRIRIVEDGDVFHALAVVDPSPCAAAPEVHG